MGGLFYNLGKRAGPAIRQGRWMWRSLTGSEAEARRAEEAVGRDLAARTRQRLGVHDDPDDRRLLEEIGTALSDRLTDRRRPFRFESVREGGANAFALPGGFVFVTRGLLDLCGWDREELAFVLGHEIGHVVGGHALERMVGRPALGSVVRALPVGGVLGTLVGRAGLAFLESAHSRDQEREADRIGVRLAEAAGFDPAGAVRFLDRLAVLEGPGGPGYLASHPHPAARIRSLRLD